MPRNDIQSQADISTIILLYKLLLQSVMLALSLGVKAKVFGFGLEAQRLETCGVGLCLATQGQGLHLALALFIVVSEYCPVKQNRVVLVFMYLLCLAETDLVLPLIRNNPSCLDVKNNDGVTARQLLEDFKDRMRRTRGEQHCHPEVLNFTADCLI